MPFSCLFLCRAVGSSRPRLLAMSLTSPTLHFLPLRDGPLRQPARSFYHLRPRPRLRGIVIVASSSSSDSTFSPLLDSRWSDEILPLANPTFPSVQPSSKYVRLAFDDFSEDDSDREVGPNKDPSSTLDNVDDWKWNLSMFTCNKMSWRWCPERKKIDGTMSTLQCCLLEWVYIGVLCHWFIFCSFLLYK